MIEGHNIICFSNDWDQDPLSKHHVMGRLAKQNRVLWVNSIGLRTPAVNRQDLAKIGHKVRAFVKGPRRVHDNLHVMTPLVIPFHGNPAAGKINCRILRAQVRHCQRRLGLKRPIVWSFLPNVDGVIGSFGGKLCIYYITDDFTQFTGYPAAAIRRMEQSLVERCDLVIASAKRLAEKKAIDGKAIKVVSHGVDHRHFEAALGMKEKDWPVDIRGIRRPVIGFYGEINDWLDLRMLAEAASKRPEWSFVLIGRTAAEAADIGFLEGRPNVHRLGQKKFSELPAYCAAFDVALVPMKINELTLNVNPLKLREYLAAGVPVVSAPLPEVLSYDDVVRFARTSEEFIDAVEAMLRQDRASLSPVLSRRVASEDWDGKVEEISELIEACLCR